MSKKVILALLALIIACCICFVAAGITFYFLYSEDVFSSPTYEQNQPQAYENIPATEFPTQNVVVPTEKIQPTVDEKDIYATNLYNDMYTCLDTVEEWMTINDQFVEDESLINDEEFVNELTIILEQVREDCISFGVAENPPQEYKAFNDEAIILNEFGNIFIDNFILYLETQEKNYEEAAVEAGYEFLYHLEQLKVLVQDIKPVE